VLNEVDADAITLETCSSGTADLPAIGQVITDKKVVVGVIDHHTLQIERPDQVAGLIREALHHVAPERLIISSDCGMGREGRSRRHAQYKMVAMVLGTNMVRKELGMPEAMIFPDRCFMTGRLLIARQLVATFRGRRCGEAAERAHPVQRLVLPA
jgi:5-methyltetrahydropteroyltriglutamate--homocysteine methyltransferase